MENEQRQVALSPERAALKSLMQTVSTCDAMLQRENAVLRAQIHDLTELLAVIDLFELQDVHLEAVRDRIFRRDIAPDRELLQVYRMERQLQHQDLDEALSGEATQKTSGVIDTGKAGGVPEHLKSRSSVEIEVMALQQRVEVLEREMVGLQLHQELLSETTSWSSWSAARVEDDRTAHIEEAESSSSSTGSPTSELNAQHRAEVDRLVEEEEQFSFAEGWQENASTIHEQHQRNIGPHADLDVWDALEVKGFSVNE
ncbi:uncharacterized protein IUM83_03138 [Phytophthora cinnamomi]|uniref:uncharacterized protein n=1 Tax=Phytophthora cinnamomi TaxID=4785 RepID=UPI00355AC986|nr:hypothetical protein IUM83_03138 [Phytophthora cinnamomi]